ncbi:hypothetical protein AB0C70_22770 [Streptomyces sp. NPDC048564]|uniref:hypothetical protein n=1 Tax=Streptomyces sp. NPDC048564 TaxID=3155760 RepID=UPI0034248782
MDDRGRVALNRNVSNGRDTVLNVIGDLPEISPVAFEAPSGWGCLLSCSRATASSRNWFTPCSARPSPPLGVKNDKVDAAP